MDYKRLFLFFALGLVVLSLWNAWQADYPKAAEQPPQKATSDAAQRDIPNLPKSVNQAVPAQGVSNVPTISTKAENDKGRLVSVKTGTLNVVIDKQGGNIVGVSLPQFPVSLQQTDTPFVLLNNNPNTLYVAQSGLLSQEGPDTTQGQALYTTAQSHYDMPLDTNSYDVDLTWHNAQGLRVTKRFTFYKDSYKVDVQYHVDNQTSQSWSGQYYTQIKRKEVAEERSIFHFATYTGAAISTPESHYDKVSYGDMSKSNLGLNAKGGWVAMLQHYFVSAWIPNPEQENHFYSQSLGNSEYIIGVVSPAFTVAPGANESVSSVFYAGPEEADRLSALSPHLDLTVDYGWLWFISVIIFWLMKHIYAVVGNWGWSIVFVTIFIKILFYKLSAKSYRSMAGMRKLQPKITQLKERHGDDRQKFSQEIMGLYRKEKVNPLSGCLPILVQIPVFIALYWVLIESVELRQAPFMLWIHDLSVKDPYYILHILMGLSMFIQQKLNPAPADPIQAKVMMALPLVFTVFFLNFPAGLVLYWVVNNSISILQQWYIIRKCEMADKKPKKQGKTTKKLTKQK